MRVYTLRLELDAKSTERDCKIVTAVMKLVERPLSNGKLPQFALRVVDARKIARTTD